MLDSQVPVDLRKFPPAEKTRFLDSVTKGKNQMPPWGHLFKPDEIEALWAYVVSGGK
jgi:mono/diheme cytochrome c family protein